MSEKIAIVVALVAASSVGCGGSGSPAAATSTTSDAPEAGAAPAPDASTAFASAPHHMLPVVDFNGGPILQAPEIVTVTFADDPMAPRLSAFADAVGTTHWWDAVRSGYCAAGGSPCVGQAKHVAHVVLPPLTDVQVSAGFEDDGYSARTSFKDYFRNAIATGLIPQPGPQTVYLVFPAEGVRVRQYDLLGCHEFTGYHAAMTLEPPTPGDADSGASGDAPEFAYALIPRCTPDEASVTKVASHELIEAATNPRYDDLAYSLNDKVWPGFMGGSEVADLCVGAVNGADDGVQEQGFTFQRSWSNDAVREGREPCVPAPPDTLYFNTAPQTDEILARVGEPVQMELDAFSEGPVDDWNISAVDLLDAEGGGRFLDVRFDQLSVNNGVKVTMTIELLQAPPPASWIGAPLILFSTVNGRAHFWPIAVVGD